ncbi:MAG: DUF6438 domain-containing protein [Chloroflexota bacterium]
MNKLKYLPLLLLCILGAASVNAQDSASNVAITLERTACFGTCPVYTITILEDGTVNYEGQDFVDVTGKQTSELTPETVKQMVAAFEKAGYFDWKETYDTQIVTDLPTVMTSVTLDGKIHSISHYMGDYTAPLELTFLEQWVDEMANSQLWTGVEPDTSAISNGTDTPLVTLQRNQCFGNCPVYDVALFADGTVVYAGIANVNNIGVYTFQADAAAITGITQRAQAFKYFDWQDSYEERIMTDQATVTTSIRTEDQFKRIVRYNGDPNAPVGLTWIEGSIDQLITTLAG